MISLSRCSIPLDRNPKLRPGLAALVDFLTSKSYSAHSIGAIFDFAATAGMLAGCPDLDAEDEAGAEAAFVGGLDEVPLDSPAWHWPDSFIDVESLLEPRGSSSIAPPAPIAGGSPEADEAPFEPSESDAAWWAEHSAASDPDDPMAFPVARRPDPLPHRLNAESFASVARLLGA